MSIKTENRLKVGQGEFELNRLPKRPLELLRAWDAADEYLLNTLAEDLKPSADTRILIVNCQVSLGCCDQSMNRLELIG